jgi:hypothetical protein
MVLRVRLLGSGQAGDPYRVALPTYQLLHGNISRGWALVLVPSDVHGLTTDQLAHEPVEQTTAGLAYPELCADCQATVLAVWDDRYREHRGEYALELVAAG